MSKQRFLWTVEQLNFDSDVEEMYDDNGDLISEMKRGNRGKHIDKIKRGADGRWGSNVTKANINSRKSSADVKVRGQDYYRKNRKDGESYEDFSQRFIRENYTKAKRNYAARIKSEFKTNNPNIVSADDAKFVIPGFNPARSSDYHEGSSTFAKKYFKEILADKNTRNKSVLFTAGGTGAGKSSALRGLVSDFESFAAVYDGNMAAYDSANKKVQQVLATGRTVEITAVARSPITAFKFGVIPRIKKEGRVINISTHIATHLDSAEVIAKLADTYKDDDRVKVAVIDNNGGLGEQSFVGIDKLQGIDYNKGSESIASLRKELENELKKALDSGQVTQSEYETAIQ